MTSGRFVETAELRSRFALRLAALYGAEVPAYTTLVEVSREVNAAVLAAHGADAQRLGDIARVSAERHGAIRVGTPQELAQAGRVFAAFGMHPVGFYDLRTGDETGVPVVSTAFRPTSAEQLARNPFRVFTSMLTVDDRRFFDDDTRAELDRFLASRQVFAPALLALADRAADGGGLEAEPAEQLLTLAGAAFQLSTTPIDQPWYDRLAAISSVAADIGGVTTTHINHLTPRVLDIDALYEAMHVRGVEMIDAIQGPPRSSGPDVLLRQTSFRALSEGRWFRRRDGSVYQSGLRVRFGEVEQRGLALTRRGLEKYEAAMLAIADRTHDVDPTERASTAQRVWADAFPFTEQELARRGLGWFTFTATGKRATTASASATRAGLLDAGLVEARPIVYEDFLPRSAAGIFRSNLSGAGTRADSAEHAAYDVDRLTGLLERDLAEPQELYREQSDRSVRAVAQQLGCVVTDVATGADPDLGRA